MKESYGEGLASRSGPESCVIAREGGDEALTGEDAGRVSSREITFSGAPTLSCCAEGTTDRREMASACEAPRGLRPRARMDAPHAERGRSLGLPME